MKNIHVLPTDKPTWFHKSTLTGILRKSSSCINDMKQAQGRNIYITSDEEIKEGDWFIDVIGNTTIHKSDFKKNKISSRRNVVLTTDQDLIKDGVQAIDDEFLEWFCKNPSCEEVEVYKDKRLEFEQDFHFYEIIIPKEEPKQDAFNYSLNAFKVPKEYFGKEEPKLGNTINKDELGIPKGVLTGLIGVNKQETLEEAGLKHCDILDKFPALINPLFSFKEGYKLAKKTLYSEEEAMEFFIEGYKQRAIASDLIFDNASRMYVIHLFKQFKNK